MIPRRSPPPGRSTPTASTRPSSLRPWTRSSRRESAVALAGLGVLAVLNLEGLWGRYEDPEPLLREIAGTRPERSSLPACRRCTRPRPVDAGLVAARIAELKAAGITVAVATSPQGATELASAGIRIRRRHRRHPRHHRLGRARVDRRHAAEPQAVHPRARRARHRRRLRHAPGRPAPDAHRCGRGARGLRRRCLAHHRRCHGRPRPDGECRRRRRRRSTGLPRRVRAGATCT